MVWTARTCRQGLHSHSGNHTACGLCVCFSLSVVFSGRPRGSKCWDFAPLWLSYALPCGVGLLVTDGHSHWRLCRCGRVWRGFCTDTCCYFSCVATQNEVAGVHCKFTFNCLRSCQAVFQRGATFPTSSHTMGAQCSHCGTDDAAGRRKQCRGGNTSTI